MKKIFSLITIITVIALISIACKKNTGGGAAPVSTTTSGQATVYGIINQFQDRTLIGNPNDSSCGAIVLTTNIGTVSVNSNPLTLNQNTGYYVETNPLVPMQGKATWQVSGGSGGGAFTYTTVKNIPYFTNLHLNLSSFSKANNLVITHPIIMADSIKYVITDSNSRSVFKVVVNSSTGITFTPTMMASLTAAANNPNASINIEGYSYENSIQGGKNVTFLNTSTYFKPGIIIN
jgi:hypothetical protein